MTPGVDAVPTPPVVELPLGQQLWVLSLVVGRDGGVTAGVAVGLQAAFGPEPLAALWDACAEPNSMVWLVGAVERDAARHLHVEIQQGLLFPPYAAPYAFFARVARGPWARRVEVASCIAPTHDRFTSDLRAAERATAAVCTLLRALWTPPPFAEAVRAINAREPGAAR